MQRSFEPFMDRNGILGNLPDHDTGDGAQKTGLYRFGRWYENKNNQSALDKQKIRFDLECKMLESPEKPNWYVRSPSNDKLWWKDPYCFSRDQHRSLLIAMGALKEKKRLVYLIWEHIKRFGFYQNSGVLTDELPSNNAILKFLGWKQIPDVTSPDHIAEMIRALYMAGYKTTVLLWPLLVLFDIFGLVGLLLSFPSWKNPEESDDDNLILSILQSKFALPTPISWLRRKLYKKYRPIAGDYRKDNTSGYSGPASAIAWKHRAETGAPPFIDIYNDILNKEL